MSGRIGVFDSGLGGLTILESLQEALPNHNFLYFGDNARAPYGNRSFDTIYQYTLEAVQALFDLECHLVILACNTASARALRSIQQRWLPRHYPNRRILGVIRPMTEYLRDNTAGDIGIVATPGTVRSESYKIELEKFLPSSRQVFQEACPMWVPLIENNVLKTPGAEYFFSDNLHHLLKENPSIQNLVLGCTHYPIALETIAKLLPYKVNLLPHGPIVAEKLVDYLERHPEINQKITKEGKTSYYTSENPELIQIKVRELFGKSLPFEKFNHHKFDL